MWGKNTTKTCALLRTLWKGLIQNFDTELPCSPRLFKPHREVGWWQSSHRQVYNGSPEAAHGQIQRKGFLGAYLGGSKEQPQPASGAWVCSAATCRTPTINSWGTQCFFSLGHEQNRAPSLLKLPHDPSSALSGKHKTLLPSMTEEPFSISAQCKPCQQ